MKVLDFLETKKLLYKYNIPFCKTEFAVSKKEAESFAEKIGYPVILKVFIPNLLHSTEIGGVKVGIENKRELNNGWDEILSSVKRKKPKADIKGILVQKELKGVELVVGMKRDKQFGTVLMFGMGGILTEILKDTVLRIAPVSKSDVKKMIGEIKGYEILKGFRGQPPINIDRVAKIIFNLSKLSLKEKQIKEIDLNPIIADEKKALVVDPCFLL